MTLDPGVSHKFLMVAEMCEHFWRTCIRFALERKNDDKLEIVDIANATVSTKFVFDMDRLRQWLEQRQ